MIRLLSGALLRKITCQPDVGASQIVRVGFRPSYSLDLTLIKLVHTPPGSSSVDGREGSSKVCVHP